MSSVAPSASPPSAAASTAKRSAWMSTWESAPISSTRRVTRRARAAAACSLTRLISAVASEISCMKRNLLIRRRSMVGRRLDPELHAGIEAGGEQSGGEHRVRDSGRGIERGHERSVRMKIPLGWRDAAQHPHAAIGGLDDIGEGTARRLDDAGAASQSSSICLLYTSPSPRDGLLSR